MRLSKRKSAWHCRAAAADLRKMRKRHIGYFDQMSMDSMSMRNARELADNFDLERLTPEFYANPYPTYRALRENEPVKRLPNGAYFLTRYDDLVTAYKNTKAFSSDKKKEFAPKYGDSLLYEHHTTSLVFNDPPIHTRVRRLIMGALSPRAIAEMEGDLIRLVDGLLDRLAAKGKFDLIGDFAAAIPIEVIGNLLDVPHDEREPLRDWSLAILGALEPVIGEAAFARGNKAVARFPRLSRSRWSSAGAQNPAIPNATC